MPKIGDTIRVKSIDGICAAHNVYDIKYLADYGPGWDSKYMNALCGNTYQITAIDSTNADGDRFSINDENGTEWWLIQEWFSEEEITKPYRISKPEKCRYHDEPTGITIENVMLLDNDPVDMWSKNTEDRLISESLENAGRQLKYRLRSWPICGNGGTVDLWGYLDRAAKTVTAHWCCSCQDSTQVSE